MRDIGVKIFTGDRAEDAFGHLKDRDVEVMRSQSLQAFENIRREIFTAANPLLLVGLLNRGKQ